LSMSLWMSNWKREVSIFVVSLMWVLSLSAPFPPFHVETHF
jgi:hypothetical protein